MYLAGVGAGTLRENLQVVPPGSFALVKTGQRLSALCDCGPKRPPAFVAAGEGSGRRQRLADGGAGPAQGRPVAPRRCRRCHPPVEAGSTVTTTHALLPPPSA